MLAKTATFVCCVIGAACCAAWCCIPAEDAKSSSKSMSASSGDIVTLRSSKDSLLTAADQVSFDRLGALSAAQDETGAKRMVAARELFFVAAGTKAKVITWGWLSSEVRAIGGGHDGQAMIVDNAFIHN